MLKLFNLILRCYLWINAIAWISLTIALIIFTDNSYKKLLEFGIYVVVLVLQSIAFTLVALMAESTSSKFFITSFLYFSFISYTFYEMFEKDFFSECLIIGDFDRIVCTLSKIYACKFFSIKLSIHFH